MKERMKRDKNSVCCNYNCNQGRTCPVRLGTYKPAEAVRRIAEPPLQPNQNKETKHEHDI